MKNILPKDTTATIRINKEIKKLMEVEGVSIQKIVDEYIEKNYKIKIEKNDNKEQ